GERAMTAPASDHAERVGERTEVALRPLRHLRRKLRAEAEPGGIDEVAAVHDADIDPLRSPCDDDGRGGLEIRRNAERAREVVRGAEGQDAERLAKAHQHLQYRVDRPVPARDGDALDVGTARTLEPCRELARIV